MRHGMTTSGLFPSDAAAITAQLASVLRLFEPHIDEYVDFIKRRGSRVAVLRNPDNPDGGYLPRREAIRFMDALEDLDLVVIDESFVDFVAVERLVEGLRGVERPGGGQHSTPAIELVSHAREPERSIS
ncbi:hypothetical protein AB0J55_28055 [Amycolatopsis sp. NPDC049688]|uniref:hypothetical protein n=1 Tax=Amycolatopsis sp. NPDC049688 TaxID=3154733 RepID=UPI00341CA6AA